MKNIFLKTIFSLLIILIVLLSLDKSYTFFLKNNCNLKTSYVAANNINADVLVLGSCIPFRTINPDTLEKYSGNKTYNLSANLASLSENFATLHLYLKKNKPPKILLLYISHESMDSSFTLFNTYLFPQFYSDSIIENIIKSEDPDYYKYSKIPFIKFAFYNKYETFSFVEGIKHYLTGKKKPFNPNGYLKPSNDRWDGTFDNFITINKNGIRYNWNLKNEKYLIKIIDLCSHNNIKLIFYQSPILKEFYNYYLNHNEIINKINKIANENNLQYWNFDTMKIASSRKYFIMQTITNNQGSDIFTKTLAKKLKIVNN